MKEWGGKREGSGRKKKDDLEKLKPYNFYLTAEEIEIIEKVEGKNRSEKLRKILLDLKK